MSAPMVPILVLGFGLCDAHSLVLASIECKTILDTARAMSRISGVKAIVVGSLDPDECWRWDLPPNAPHVHDRYCALLGCGDVDDHEPERTWPNVTGGR